MPGTPLAVQKPNSAGSILTRLIPAGTNNFVNNGKTILIVRNQGGASMNVTEHVQAADLDGNVIPDKVVPVGAGQEKVIGPFDRAIYNYDDGTMDVSVSTNVNVTVSALQLP